MYSHRPHKSGMEKKKSGETATTILVTQWMDDQREAKNKAGTQVFLSLMTVQT